MLDVSAVNTLNRTVQLSSIIRAQYSSGRIALPVSGGMYTRLKHVEGVPARQAGQGFPVSKLKMIDLLVDRLVQLKNQPVETVRPVDENHAQQLINDYARELSTALKSAESQSISNNALRYTVGAAETGAILNLVA